MAGYDNYLCIMQVRAVDWVGGENGYLKLIDQTKLPHKLAYLKCTTAEQVASAIKSLAVRGAPAIGVAAAFGAYLGMRNAECGMRNIRPRWLNIYNTLLSTRPTAVNLKWALDRIAVALKNGETKGLKDRKLGSSVLQLFSSLVYHEALDILKEDRVTCEKIGLNGAKLIKNGCRIFTHCNAGLLATAGIGTALAPLYIARKQGRRFSVYSSETRPVLQGARLTVWELQRNHIPVTLICDNMVGSLMQGKNPSPYPLTRGERIKVRGQKINLVIVGADRIARNGDTANKIGTYQVALMAHHHRIPFYIAAPMSTFDRNIKTGKDIPIEFRSPDEVTHIGKTLITPRHTKVYNPAFDVTPAKYIAGFITEKGIIKPKAITNYINI